MTALKPIENRRVRGVPSERYPLNLISSHPESSEPATEAHHCFPRSQQIGDSWFVEITYDTKEEAEAMAGAMGVKATKADTYVGQETNLWVIIIPHVTGLTRQEHKDIEEHRAHITLDEGVWYWWELVEKGSSGLDDQWERVGALNPQPGSREGKPKRKKQATTSAEKKAKVTYSIKTPKDEENVLPELEETLRDEFREEMGWKEDVPAYFVWVAAAAKALQ
jgi:hypothetical protein